MVDVRDEPRNETPLEDLYRGFYSVAEQVVRSGFEPDYVIGLLKGGTEFTKCMNTLLLTQGNKIETYFIDVKKPKSDEPVVIVNGLESLPELYGNILLCDEISDTAFSTNETKKILRKRSLPHKINIRTAVYFFNPTNHSVGYPPDYFGKITDRWEVLPTEEESRFCQEALERLK